MNSQERKDFARQIRHCLREFEFSSDKKTKIQIAQKIYDYCLEHRTNVFFDVEFYNVVIEKLHEFISQDLSPEFTTYCIATLRTFFLDNTAPNDSLTEDLRIRSLEILNSLES